MTHTVTIKDVDNPKYPVLVSCTCAFQAHCRNEAEADYYKRHHESAALMNEATKGWAHGHQ